MQVTHNLLKMINFSINLLKVLFFNKLLSLYDVFIYIILHFSLIDALLLLIVSNCYTFQLLKNANAYCLTAMLTDYSSLPRGT